MILLIDKPNGVTSFDVIRQLRKKLGIRKMGHAGTLDPMASGLLIVATESDTKQLDQFLKLPKVYEAEILLGQQTDTGDVEGAVIEQTDIPDLNEETIVSVLESMIGTHTFPAPMYSAIKVDGKALYKYAREGKTPPRIPEKEMAVRNIQFTNFQFPNIQVTIDVASGTYIRVLAEEIGRRLGTVATLSGLRRISIGQYMVTDANKLEEL